MTNPATQNQLTLKAEDATAMGRFSNLAQVTSHREVFSFDFAFVQGKLGWLLSRILLSPSHAKRFHGVLGETLARYEEQFGPIDPGPTLQ